MTDCSTVRRRIIVLVPLAIFTFAPLVFGLWAAGREGCTTWQRTNRTAVSGTVTAPGVQQHTFTSETDGRVLAAWLTVDIDGKTWPCEGEGCADLVVGRPVALSCWTELGPGLADAAFTRCTVER